MKIEDLGKKVRQKASLFFVYSCKTLPFSLLFSQKDLKIRINITYCHILYVPLHHLRYEKGRFASICQREREKYFQNQTRKDKI